MEEWNKTIDRKYKNSIKRSLIVPIFPTTAEDRISDYLKQVGYKIVSTYPDLVATRIYSRSINQPCPPYSNSILNVRFIKENDQTRVEINYRINSLSPWEKAFYFTEIKDLQTALNCEMPIHRSTTKVLWMIFFIYLAIGCLGIGGIGILGGLLAVRVLPLVTGYPKYHWINGVTAFVITILLYTIEFLYLHKLSSPSKVFIA